LDHTFYNLNKYEAFVYKAIQDLSKANENVSIHDFESFMILRHGIKFPGVYWFTILNNMVDNKYILAWVKGEKRCKVRLLKPDEIVKTRLSK
jgi:hypothetical protein